MSEGFKFYQSARFREINREWQKKLKESGFSDIEYTFPNGDTSGLTKPAIGVCGPQPSLQKYNARIEYYTMASKFLHDFKFSTRLDFKIWELHSDGFSYRKIVKTCNAHTIYGVIDVNYIFAFMKEIKPKFYEYMRLYNGHRE